MSKLQDQGFKSSSEAGADSRLTPDTQIYITANSINTTLSDAITAGTVGNASFAITVNSSSGNYSMSSTANGTILVNRATALTTYQLPTATAGYRFGFINDQAISEMQIQPASSAKIIQDGGNVTENAGYISIKRQGVSVWLLALDSTTWVVERIVNLQHEKNTSIGISDKEISYVGKDTWTSKTNDNVSRRYFASFSLNGYGYGCGGDSSLSATTISTTTQYNDSQNSWTTKAGVSGTARLRLAGHSLNGYGYAIVGNDDSSTYYSFNSQYNDYLNSWTNKTVHPLSIASPSNFQLNGMAYVAGGRDSSNSISNLYQYNDSADSWSSKSGIPNPNEDGSAVMLNGYGYYMQGLDTNSGSARHSSTYQYNDSSNAWIQRANTASSTSGAAVCAINGNYFIMGGSTGSLLSTTEQYNDSLNSFTTKSNISAAKRFHGSFSNSGYGYQFDGRDASATLSTVQQYN